ncbi:hypothetical protein QH494_06305 [Sphingomonas sp. AR_OL41]|uniref:hypothetical protein n=1 Tax=Sphingomonas sp. AR_OL41 TaxID=3042729 RepID=UPI002480EFE6|nr:hypothetical protein [Sphingomonas sp. AR_OL41]MDH7971791.1 hypothetical protein [Sphingomonas sp. AR_OL41]
MRAGSPKKRTGGWLRVDIDLSEAGELMRKFGFVMCADDPVESYGHRDRLGNLRRVHARYPAGWRSTLVLRLNGNAKLSQTLKTDIPLVSA